MKIQSNISVTSQKSQQLRALCNSIGKTSIECGNQTTLSAVRAVVPLFAKNNATYKSYRRVLEDDGYHINSIGITFRNFDMNLMR